VLSLREKEYIEAARALGAGPWRIMFIDILPNIVAPIIVYATLLIPVTIVIEASLSYLGVGVPPPTADWGTMISGAQQIYQQAWWYLLFPSLALLITTAAVVAIATQDSVEQTKFGSGPILNLLTNQVADQQFSDNYSQTGAATTGAGPAASVAPLAARLNQIPGVHGVMVVRDDPGLSIPGSFHDLGGSPPSPIPAGVVSCAQLATVPVLGRCPAGATAAAFPADGVDGPLFGLSNLSGFVWPAVNVPVTRLDSLRVDAVSVATDGSVPAVERARTALENAYTLIDLNAPATLGDLIVADNSTNNDYQQLANVVILVSLVIAGCTLAAGIAAGLADRKRPFSLLRLTGARLATLRRVVALEGAVPLLTVAAVAIGAGFGGAEMNASLQQGHSIVAPGAAYYLITAGGILVALGVIAATFPLLTRITGPEAARND